MSDFQPAPHQGTPVPSTPNPMLDPHAGLPRLPQGPTQSFSIQVFDAARLPDRATADTISALFHKTYGPQAYPSNEFANGQNVIAEIAAGRMISQVAFDAHGIAVGHAAVIPVGEKSAEIGRLFVDPSTRGHNIGKLLAKAQVDAAADMHARGEIDFLYADAVTAHQTSQRLYAGLNMQSVGIFDRKYTDFFGVGNREGVLRQVILFEPAIQSHRDVFLPIKLQPLAKLVFGNTQCNRSVYHSTPPHVRYNSGGTALALDSAELKDFGALTLLPEPGRPAHTLLTDVSDAFASGAQHLSVKIDVNHPHSLTQCEALLSAGFYFASIETRPFHDYVTLQALPPSEPKNLFPHIQAVFPRDGMDLLQLALFTHAIP